MPELHKTQVEKFADRCFVKFAKRFRLTKPDDLKNPSLVGIISYIDDECSWEINVCQSSLVVKSRFFSGEIAYVNITSCNAAEVSEQDGLTKRDNIYDMSHVRRLTDEEIEKLYRSQNGVLISYAGRQANILLCTDSFEKTVEIISNLCDFIWRIQKTQAWISDS